MLSHLMKKYYAKIGKVPVDPKNGEWCIGIGRLILTSDILIARDLSKCIVVRIYIQR